MSPKYRMAVYILPFIDLCYNFASCLERVQNNSLWESEEVRNSGKFQIENHLQNTGIILERRS